MVEERMRRIRRIARSRTQCLMECLRKAEHQLGVISMRCAIWRVLTRDNPAYKVKR